MLNLARGSVAAVGIQPWELEMTGLADTGDLLASAEEHSKSAGRKQVAHYLAAAKDASFHRWIGLPSVALSAFVATSIFSKLTESSILGLRLLTGAAAVLAAVLASLQAFLGFAERAEKHRVAGAKYGKVRNELDILELQLAPAASVPRADGLVTLQATIEELSALEVDAPTLTNSEYDKGKARFDAGHRIDPGSI